MSPASQRLRKSNAQSQRSKMIRKLEKRTEADVTLSDEQHEEMCSLAERVSSEDLDKIFLEGSEHGVGNLIKDIEYTDSRHQRQKFLDDRSKNGIYISMCCTACVISHFSANGAHGNRWSLK